MGRIDQHFGVLASDKTFSRPAVSPRPVSSKRCLFIAALSSCIAALFVSCARPPAPGQDSTATGTADVSAKQAAPGFRIVAYATEAIPEDRIPYAKLTEINYSFLLPNSDGTFRAIRNPAKLSNIVHTAHSRKVAVNISVGGWGLDPEFEAMAAHSATRSAFVSNAVAFVREFNLDGLDLDWEYPDPGQSSDNFLALVRELRAALPGKRLSTAVVSYGDRIASGIPTASFAEFDCIYVMTYDGRDHATMGQFESGLKYWTDRGVTREKLIIGVPFYGRALQDPQKTLTYAKLLEIDKAAANRDKLDVDGLTYVYNGIPTIEKKTRIAMDSAGGIMFWVLNADAPGEFSLLSAIHGVAHGPE